MGKRNRKAWTYRQAYCATACKTYLLGNKTDYNDALAIAEAVVRPEMRFVRTKTQTQQDIQALHVLRKKCERDRTANSNEIRRLLYEYGIVIPQGVQL